MSANASALRRTPLFEQHREAGARIVPFAGWEMPVQYEGVRQEHTAVRRAAGVFDVSHMGQVETRGPQALQFLQLVLSNDVAKIALGGAQYSVACNEDGGVLDDLFTYRLDEDRYLTVTNASNHESDFAWLRRWSEGFEVTVADRHADFAMLAVQGPDARGHVERLADDGLPGRFRTAALTLRGARALVCGTGYTGEDGVELLLDPSDAPDVWDRLVDDGVTPVGLAARDTLRLEACFHLYGNDLSDDRDPIGAGLGWCCKEETGFVGSDRVRAVREAGPAEKLVPFAFTGPGIPRQGNAVVGGGVVTSGTMSPCLERGVGLAYVPAPRAAPGTSIEVDVRGKVREAEVRPKPLYPPPAE